MNYLTQSLSTQQLHNVEGIRIYFENLSVCLGLDVHYPTAEQYIQYQKSGDDTIIRFSGNCDETVVEDKDYVAVFCDDFKYILSKQNTILKGFHVFFQSYKYEDPFYLDRAVNRFYNFFKTVARQRAEKLKVNESQFSAANVEQLVSILPYLDCERLYINLEFPRNQREVNIDLISETDLWSHVRNPITMDITMYELSSRNLEILKTAILSTRTFYVFVIKYDITCEDAKLNELLGHVIVRENTCEEKIIRCLELPKKEFLQTSIELEEEASYKTMTLSRGSLITLNGFVSGYNCEAFEYLSTRLTEFDRDDPVLKVFHNPLVMRKFLKYLGFYDIQSLCQLSRGIHSNIHKIRPSPGMKIVWIEIEDVESVKTRFTDRDRCLQKQYEKREPHEETQIDEFFNDFVFKLSHQEECLELFELRFCYDLYVGFPIYRNVMYLDKGDRSVLEVKTTEILERLSETMKKLSLRIKKMCIYALIPSHIIQFLRISDSNFLKSIEIQNPYHGNFRREIIETTRYRMLERPVDHTDSYLLDIEEVTKLEQWRMAEELKISTYLITTEIEKSDLLHFARVEIFMNAISSNEIIFLKNELLNSPTLKKFQILFKTCNIDGNFYPLMGQPFLMTLQKSVWYFRALNTGFILQVVYTFNKSVTFARIQPEVVPEGALHVRNEDEEDDLVQNFLQL